MTTVKGLSFPFIINNGSVVTGDINALIKSSLTNIISYNWGIRFFDYDFGAFTKTLLKEPNDIILHSLMITYLKDAINAQEIRIDIQGNPIITKDNLGKLGMQLNYQIKSTQQLDSLTYLL